tara:strand:+ start:88 stop:216 length:129 start_codon:yes stop_codon:yes gene_type:complete
VPVLLLTPGWNKSFLVVTMNMKDVAVLYISFAVIPGLPTGLR